MSLTAQIASTDSSFKLSQKLVASLAEKFGFKFEDGWATVSNSSVEKVQKRLKREKKKTNPAAGVKHSRTAFSFFTQKQRPLEAAKHPKATFGELSRFVSQAWKALTPAELKAYKDMEAADKTRYQTERTAALAAAPAAAAAAVAAAPAEVATEVKPKREKKAKAAATTEAAPAAAPAKAEKPAKAPKAAKAAPVAAAPAPAPVAAPAAVAALAVKITKLVKTAKAAAAPAVVAAAPAAKPAAKAPKAKAAGKA